jgi:hypothetical protein
MIKQLEETEIRDIIFYLEYFKKSQNDFITSYKLDKLIKKLNSLK